MNDAVRQNPFGQVPTQEGQSKKIGSVIRFRWVKNHFLKSQYRDPFSAPKPNNNLERPKTAKKKNSPPKKEKEKNKSSQKKD